MPISYFEEFPKVPIKVGNKNIQYTDYFRFVDVNELFLPGYNNYLNYEIKDGARPDQVSYELYESTDFYWTFFVLNDHLKNGIKEWPLSQSSLDRKILNDYGDFSICEIGVDPIYFQNFIFSGTDIIYNGTNLVYSSLTEIESQFVPNIFGLDLSHKWLRVYNVDTNNGYGKIEKFDSSRWQLWIKDVKDSNFFTTSDKIGIKLINPHSAGTPEYDIVEAENLNWLKSMKGWYETHFGEVTDSDEFLQSEFEEKLIFNIQNFYPMAENAPDYYYNPITGDKLSHYIAQQNFETAIPKIYLETEEKKNEDKRTIKVLRRDIVRTFVNMFNQKLNETKRLSI